MVGTKKKRGRRTKKQKDNKQKGSLHSEPFPINKQKPKPKHKFNLKTLLFCTTFNLHIHITNNLPHIQQIYITHTYYIYILS